MWDDAPVSYDRGDNKTWTPHNYGKEQYGNLSLRQALAYSNNVVTVKLLDTIGVPYFVDFAARMGLPLRPESGLSLALGTGEATLKDMVLAYTPLTNGGSRPEARTIIRTYGRKRHAFTENPPSSAPVLSPATAFVTTRMLMDVMQYGTAKGLRKFSLEHPSAGKTGTTDDYRDAWFIGYTPRIITGVWVGYDKPKPLGKGFTGGTVAAPIWERFMESAIAARPSADFPKPDTVISATIDPETGFLAKTGCTKKIEEFFIAGTEPTEFCAEHAGEPIPPVTSPRLNPDAPEELPDITDSNPGR
jgi:membrane carboxypeptidase/penicillin-binding protein